MSHKYKPAKETLVEVVIIKLVLDRRLGWIENLVG